VCRSCGLRYQEIRPGEDGSIYADEELAQEAATGRAAALLYLDGDALRTLRKLTPGRRLLDVGSGDGRFLRAAIENGFSGVGVDISPKLAELARARSGAEIRVGELSEIGLPACSFDAVNLDLVLMYVPDPLRLMSEVARLLAPGGVCRVREFLADSLNARRQGSEWWFLTPYTLRAYTRRAVSVLARRCGLVTARAFPGTEASYTAWREFVRRKRGSRLASSPACYLARKVSLPGGLLANDCVFYLRKAR
jgi:SAM-dependent methyltransferase